MTIYKYTENIDGAIQLLSIEIKGVCVDMIVNAKEPGCWLFTPAWQEVQILPGENVDALFKRLKKAQNLP